MQHPNALLAAQRIIHRRLARRFFGPALGALVVLALALAWSWPVLPEFGRWTATMIRYAGELALGAAAFGASGTHRLHGRLLEQHRGNWLASAPIPEAHRRAFDRRMLRDWFAVRSLVLLGVLTVAGCFAGSGNAPRLAVGGAAVLAAFGLGALAGWRYTASALAAWVRARIGRRRAAYQRRPDAVSGLRALERLCSTRMGNEASGRHVATLVTPVLLVIPAGTGAGTALCVLGVWLCIVLYANLWRVTRRTLTELDHWLAATPLPSLRLIWLAGHRPISVCLVIGAVCATLLGLLGLPPLDAAFVAVVPAVLGVAVLFVCLRRVHS